MCGESASGQQGLSRECVCGRSEQFSFGYGSLDKSMPIAVDCWSGYRSTTACRPSRGGWLSHCNECAWRF